MPWNRTTFLGQTLPVLLHWMNLRWLGSCRIIVSLFHVVFQTTLCIFLRSRVSGKRLMDPFLDLVWDMCFHSWDQNEQLLHGECFSWGSNQLSDAQMFSLIWLLESFAGKWWKVRAWYLLTVFFFLDLGASKAKDYWQSNYHIYIYIFMLYSKHLRKRRSVNIDNVIWSNKTTTTTTTGLAEVSCSTWTWLDQIVFC